MKSFVCAGGVLFAALLLSSCDAKKPPAEKSSTASSAEAKAPAADMESLATDNAKLRAEVAALRKQVEELSLTPSALLRRVTETLKANKPAEARQASETLNKRFADSSEAKAARATILKYDAAVKAREAEAKAIEARGFYALQPQNAPTVKGITVRVESLRLGSRWQFDAHGDELQYRDSERGERYVLLRATLHSAEKDPDLPDIGIYRIDGGKMTRLAQMNYEFRRWSSYGTFIGLYYDFANDFAHTATIPFNAAASISDEDAKKPFAVVITGELCHERGSAIGQPDVVYRLSFDCPSKPELDANDFTNGGYRVLAFFNHPKGG
jgi:hypothetical protein